MGSLVELLCLYNWQIRRKLVTHYRGKGFGCPEFLYLSSFSDPEVHSKLLE